MNTPVTIAASVPIPQRQALGLWMATALVIGNMIGSGLFLLPSVLAPYGGAALLGWGVSLGGMLLLALVFARLGLERPARGGPYAYARMAFGDATGFGVAWSYWISNACGNAAIAVAFAGYFGSLLPAHTASPIRDALIAIAALCLCTFTNLRGARSAGHVQLVTTVLKFLPLFLIAAAGVIYFQPAQWHPFNRSGLGLTGVTTTTVALTVWAFLGVECATVAGADIRDPRRTIPRATLIGTALAGVATVVACMAVIGLLPAAKLAASGAPFADAASHLWGPAAGAVLAVVAAISCFGALNGWTLMQGQVGLAMADDGLFPAAFTRCDARGTPFAALLISSVLSSLLVLANFQKHLVALFTFAILLSTATALLPYLVCSAAALRLHEPRRSPIRATVQILIALLALVFSLWALIGTGGESLIWSAVLLLAGVPIYLWRKRKANAIPQRA
ncbi:MAG: amino acid permease [Rhodanobacteraceae bacterium]